MYSEILFMVLLISMAGVACSGGTAPARGVRDGRLAPCPGSPNCVSSQSDDPDHYIEPFTYTGPTKEALSRLMQAVGSMKRARILEMSGTYLRVEFRSMVFRFVDDVEFYAEPGAGVIHVRSASRVGYSDLGVNRKRVEQIRNLFNAG